MMFLTSILLLMSNGASFGLDVGDVGGVDGGVVSGDCGTTSIFATSERSPSYWNNEMRPNPP